ncbi:MAG: ABC transporter permease subunit [Gemmatimonadaceae bacterium]|nr:ABC transporter permease subunit [Gemmatimonadaceae bacterium]
MANESGMTAAQAGGGAEASVIHDLGYRRYEGARDGARGAFHALTWQGIRTLLGIGRPLKAKAVPVFVAVVTMLPALASLAAAGASGGQMPVRYGALVAPQLLMFVLMAAAQAPELFSRDVQHRVLPLLFTRDLTRDRYVAARWLALFTVMFAVALAPLLLLYLGEIGIAKDPAATFANMRGKIGPVLLLATCTGWVLASVSALLSSLTARRAYATAATLALFLVSAAVVSGLEKVAGLPEGLAAVLQPIEGYRTLALQLFGETSRAMELTPPPAVWIYLASYGGIGALAIAGLVWRVRRLSV